MTRTVLSLRTDYEAHLAKDVLEVLVGIMVAGFDGDEPDGNRTLERYLEERDAAAAALAETALEGGERPERAEEMRKLIVRMWDRHPSVKDWLDREFTITR